MKYELSRLFLEKWDAENKKRTYHQLDFGDSVNQSVKMKEIEKQMNT